MNPSVGLVGTFEVSNYGDLLFPLVAQGELGRRRPDADYIWFGPIGESDHAWPTVVGLGPLTDDRIARVSALCDVVVIGGGDLIRESDLTVAPSYGMTARDALVWRPNGWFRTSEALANHGAVVAWNAVGVAEPVEDGEQVVAGASYLSVRDGTSVEHLGVADPIAIVPDSGFLMDRVFMPELLDDTYHRLVAEGSVPDEEYIVVQAAASVGAQLDYAALEAAVGGRRVAAIQIGPCHGDGESVEAIVAHFGSAACALPVPGKLEEIAAVISRGAGFIGNSLHGAVTSLVYDVPFALLDFERYSKRRGVLEVAGLGPERLVTDPTSIPRGLLAEAATWDRSGVNERLDEHFDRLADLIPPQSDAAPLRWEDRPELLHAALERPPAPLVLNTSIAISTLEPPEPPIEVAAVVDSLLAATRRRDEVPDPVIAELESALESTEIGWQQSVDHAEMLDRSRAAAEKGWTDAVTQTEALGASLARAETGLERAQSRIGRLSQGLAGLDAQLVSRVACWRSDVAGPAVTAEAPEPDRLAEYDFWLTRAAARPQRVPASTEVVFSILTPVYNPPAALLEALIRSVRAQTYDNWELVLVDGSDAPHVAPICDRFAALDSRIRIVHHENLGISANTNLAAEHATGDWFLLVDHDDELAPHALAAFAEGIEAAGGLAYGYSDEDKIDETGRRSDPFFKPDWSPDLLRTLNYITHLQGVRRDLWEEIGGLRSKTDGAQDYDLALRASAAAGGAFHVDDVLYHWRVHSDSTAGDVGVKPHAHRAGRRALEDYAQLHAPDSWIEFGTGPTSHRFRYPVVAQPLSVIIPFRDGAAVTETCLTGIARTGTALPLEVLLIDNQSSDPQTHERIAEWQERYSWVRVLRYDEPFNFQKLNNWAAEHATGELLLFLNNDTEPFHEGWVEALAEHAQRPEVGAVGGRLFYPNGLVQHAGAAVGIGGYAEHPWAGLHPDAWTPAGPSYWTRNFLSVTAACLMVHRSKFEEVGGFDERFTIGGGDVALGLALREHGYWNVMTPYARLIHHESVTRGTVVPESDLLISRAVYEPFLDGRDPFYNANLTLDDTRCGLR